MLEEKQVLKSVEVLEQSSLINVLWENQILRDGIVISSSNHRCSYGSGQREQFLSDLSTDGSRYVDLITW